MVVNEFPPEKVRKYC